jgi:hypothetical protein
MPCQNKFQHKLNLEHLDYEPESLIVGTFNPDIGELNKAEWFYGRTENTCLWNVLPRLYGEESLITGTTDDWEQFCRRNRIAFTDIISSIDDADLNNKEQARALAGFSDRAIEYKFEDFTFVNILQILKSRPTIKNVYLTRGVTEAFWRHLWNPVMQYCNKNGFHERRLVSPSEDSHDQHAAYNDHNPGCHIPVFEDFVLMRWKGEWHF